MPMPKLLDALLYANACGSDLLLEAATGASVLSGRLFSGELQHVQLINIGCYAILKVMHPVAFPPQRCLLILQILL